MGSWWLQEHSEAWRHGCDAKEMCGRLGRRLRCGGVSLDCSLSLWFVFAMGEEENVASRLLGSPPPPIGSGKANQVAGKVAVSGVRRRGSRRLQAAGH